MKCTMIVFLWAKDERSKMINCWNVHKLTAAQNFLKIIKSNGAKNNNNDKTDVGFEEWGTPHPPFNVGGLNS